MHRRPFKRMVGTLSLSNKYRVKNKNKRLLNKIRRQQSKKVIRQELWELE